MLPRRYADWRKRRRTGQDLRCVFTACHHIGSQKWLCPAREQWMHRVYALLRSDI